MADAKAIGQFVIGKYITPARNRGDYVVGVRSGEVHDDMGLHQKLPAVCSVLGSNTFNRTAKVRRIAVEGPINGASTLFMYRLK
ncbi:MAG TPA: hypothetical protein G4O12_01865 [Dehalococcoidia bacterium]|nr:hypothetical protein [Dehalococcoidia bacterium]